jgi:hypothetical protein
MYWRGNMRYVGRRFQRRKCWRDSIILLRHREWRDKTKTLKNHNSLIDTTSNKNEIYMKIVVLAEIYNFVVLSFFI